MEQKVLLWIHAHSHPVLDAAFRASHELATQSFCFALVIVMIVFHLWRGNRRTALLWLCLGLSTLLIDQTLKPLFGRDRPALWTGPIHLTSYSLPSGHAVASATFYLLLAWSIGQRFPRFRTHAYGGAALLALYIGVGRLYLGVHWPTDVLAGWTIGTAQTLLAIRLARPKPLRTRDESTPIY